MESEEESPDTPRPAQPKPRMKHITLKSLLAVSSGLAVVAFVPSAVASEAEDMFHKMDLNNDKVVTSLEYANFADAMFKQTDSDQDGQVSAAECLAAQSAAGKKKVDQKAVAAHMQLVDADHDGQISRAEHETFVRQEFTRADRNGNGSLDEDEVEDAHRAMEKQMKG